MGAIALTSATIATACAWWLALLFAWAAVAKLASHELTASAFASLDLRQPALLARLVPVIEIAVTLLLVAIPVIGGLAAFVILVAFTTIVIRATRRGSTAPCACFGGVAERPIAWPDVIRNLALMGLALVSTLGEAWQRPGVLSMLVVGGAIAVGAALLWALRQVEARSSA